MNNKTLIKLEFDKIISMLENEASYFRGKQLCRRLKPVTDLTKIDLLQEQTAAANEDQNGNAPEPVTKILNSLQYNHTFLLSRETIGDFLCDCACAFCVLCLVRFDRVSQRREG